MTDHEDDCDEKKEKIQRAIDAARAEDKARIKELEEEIAALRHVIGPAKEPCSICHGCGVTSKTIGNGDGWTAEDCPNGCPRPRVTFQGGTEGGQE